MAKTTAYIRVSTDRQDMENQRLEILKLANQVGLGQVLFVEETISGRKSWRSRGIAKVMDDADRGDAVVVSELSRLGRSMLEIMEILSVATTAGIRIFAAKGNWRLDGTIQSKVVAMAFAMASEIERDLISQRTKSALAVKKAQGIRLGRPTGPGRSKLDPRRDEIIEMLKSGVSRVRLAQRLGCSESNLRHWLRQRELTRIGKR